MLAYKIVAGALYSINVLVLIAKTAQGLTYHQHRVAVINALGGAIGLAMLVWTLLL